MRARCAALSILFLHSPLYCGQLILCAALCCPSTSEVFHAAPNLPFPRATALCHPHRPLYFGFVVMFLSQCYGEKFFFVRLVAELQHDAM